MLEHDRYATRKEMYTWARGMLDLPNQYSTDSIQNADGLLTTYYSGKPRDIKQVPYYGERLRHYITDLAGDQALARIMQEDALRVGRTPYAIVGSRSKAYWMQVTGAFMTRPDIDPTRVGVAGSRRFVDFSLVCDTPLIAVANNILLVAGPLNAKIPIQIIGQGKL